MKISELLPKKLFSESGKLIGSPTFFDGYNQARQEDIELLDRLESEGKIGIVPSVEEIEKAMQDTFPITYEYQVILTTSQFKLFAQRLYEYLLKGK